MKSRSLACWLALFLALATVALAADDKTVALRLAKQAHKAQDAGQLVRAYLLFSEAALRDPKNKAYRDNRDAIAPLVQLLTKADVTANDIKADIARSESDSGDDEPSPFVEPSNDPAPLQPLPTLKPETGSHDFDLMTDDKAAIAQIASSYGISTVFDPSFESRSSGRFQISAADFRTAMEGITSVTGTFVFPVTEHSIFIARDTELKRTEFEPISIVTVPLPEALDPKEVVEAANAVRSALALRSVSWDSAGRFLVIRDRVDRARTAASLLAALITPRAQLSFEVQIVAADSATHYHYGAALPTSFPTLNYAHIGAFQPTVPNLSSLGQLFAFAVGKTNFFGVALGNATLLAQYSKSTSQVVYDANVTVADGQTANFHVGDKYPIPQAISTGYQQLGNSPYNPIGQVTMEDLGIVLKLSPHVNGDGDISLDLEAQYKTLGADVIEGIPAIGQREFKGSVRLKEGELAVIAGMRSLQNTRDRSGIPGLAQTPGIDQVLAENTRDDQSSDTLIVIKPTITRLPVSSLISPQFLVGGRQGEKVLM